MRTHARCRKIAAIDACGAATAHTTADPFPEIGRPDLRGTRTPSDTHPGVFLFASAKNGRQTRFPERFFRIVASRRARNLRDAKGFALLFSGHASRFEATRFEATRSSQQVPKHPAANVRTMKSAHGSRSRGIHHEARKCCVAMLDAGGGSDPNDTDAYAHASRDPKHRRGTHMTIRATAHTGARP